MRLEWRLARRNVWRQPRRTGLTVAATVFAVVIVVFFVAMAAGIHEKMIEDSVRVHSGHLTLAGPGYLERRTLEHFVRLDPALEALLAREPGVVAFAPRVVGFGLLSRDSSTQGVAVVGLDPVREAAVTTLGSRVEAGSFLAPAGRREIVLGQALARRLGARRGDELLLYSVAYSMESAYELFRVVGTVRLPDAELERTLALVSLSDAQDFFVYGDRLSEVAVLVDEPRRVRAVAAGLRTALAGAPVEVHTWQQVMPELEQIILLDDVGMYLVLAILVVVVAFGIFNTVLMAVLERQREFGVLLALGLRPRSVWQVVFLESLLLAGVGLAVGLALALPLVLYFQAHPVPLEVLFGERAGEFASFVGFDPVITWKLLPGNPLGSAATVLGVAVVAALYPAYKASRGRPVDVLRGL